MSLLDSLNLNNNNNIIIIPKYLSKEYIRLYIEDKELNNDGIFYMDEYIFSIHNVDIKESKNKDVIRLNKIIDQINDLYEKIHLKSSVDKIINVLNQITYQRYAADYTENNNLFETLHSSLNDIEKNSFDAEGQVIEEIWKLWIKKSKSDQSTAEKYISLLNDKPIIPDIYKIHVIGSDSFLGIEKNWLNSLSVEHEIYKIESSGKNINRSFFNSDYSINFNIVKDYLKNISSKNFSTMEQECLYISNEINKCLDKNDNLNIGLIHNDWYFARRLRAILERYSIGIKDYDGWALSTSSVSAFINKCFDYYVEGYKCTDLFDIVNSPCFLPALPEIRKEQFLKYIEKLVVNNIETTPIKPSNIPDAYKEIKNALTLDVEIPNNSYKISHDNFFKFLNSIINTFKSNQYLDKDNAGKKILSQLNKFEHITKESDISNMEINIWRKMVNNQFENSRFSVKKFSKNIRFTDINHALISNFDSLFICSMSSYNYPKKKIHDLLLNKSVYSDFMIKNIYEKKNNIDDILSLKYRAKKLYLSYHFQNGNESLNMSKYKKFIDLLKNEKKCSDNDSLKKNNLEINYRKPFGKFSAQSLSLNNSDIKSFNSCEYSFYLNKISKENNILKDKKYLTGTYIHKCIETYIKENLSDNILFNQDRLKIISDNIAQNYFTNLENSVDPFLWKNLINNFCALINNDLLDGISVTAEKYRQIDFEDNIKLTGRVDILIKGKNNNKIIDIKTTSQKPTIKSVVSGDEPQLSVYSMLYPEVDELKYYFINLHKQEISEKSYNKNDLKNATEKNKNLIEVISNKFINSDKFEATDNIRACEKCYVKNICRPSYWK